MNTTLGRFGALLAGSAVATGAFGTHLLESRISIDAMGTYETAVLYQLVHGVALLAIAVAATGRPALEAPGRLLGGGTVLFAGVLYALALGGPRVLGAVAPLGGGAMIVAWLWLAVRLGTPAGSSDLN